MCVEGGTKCFHLQKNGQEERVVLLTSAHLHGSVKESFFEKVVLEEWWFLIVLLRRVHLHGSVKESLFFVVVERMVLKERWSITRVVSCQEFHCTFLRTVPAVFYMPRSCKEGLPKVVFDWDSEIEGRLWSDCSVAVHFSS